MHPPVTYNFLMGMRNDSPKNGSLNPGLDDILNTIGPLITFRKDVDLITYQAS
jgi:hypothetical protein